MLLYGAGSTVLINDGTVDAVILAITIHSYSPQGIQYQVAYWYEGERYIEWVYAYELCFDVSKPTYKLDYIPPNESES